MSTINVEDNQLITCDLCKRRYNINVYKRHKNENQCIKRNYHRLPFQSIKQRSIQIGDQIFSVQQQLKKSNEIQILNNRAKKQQQIFINKNKQYQDKFQRISLSNNHRRTLEQAKQLLERRTKYKPPWIKTRLNFPSNNLRNQEILTQKSNSHQQSSTKLKNNNFSIKTSISNHKISQQSTTTHLPEIQTSQISPTSKYQLNRIDQTFSPKQITSASRSARKANTWTRSSKQRTNRDVISPIHIPTFSESSSSNHFQIPFNQNYDDDDDEFERYSPTPSSTPKNLYENQY